MNLSPWSGPGSVAFGGEIPSMSKAEVTLVGLFGVGPGGLRFSAIAAAIVGGSGLLVLGSYVGPVGAGGVIELANAVGGAVGNVEGVVW